MGFFVVWLTEKLAPETITSLLSHLFDVEEKAVGSIFLPGDCSVNFERRFLGRPPDSIKEVNSIAFIYELCVFPHSDAAKSCYKNNLTFSLAFSEASGLPVSISDESTNPYQYLLIDKTGIYVANQLNFNDKAYIILSKHNATLLSTPRTKEAWCLANEQHHRDKPYLMGDADWWTELVMPK